MTAALIAPLFRWARAVPYCDRRTELHPRWCVGYDGACGYHQGQPITVEILSESSNRSEYPEIAVAALMDSAGQVGVTIDTTACTYLVMTVDEAQQVISAIQAAILLATSPTTRAPRAAGPERESA